MVGKQDAVGIAIKADAQISFAGDNFIRRYFGMQRATVFVDIAAVGSAVGEVRLRATPLENFWSNSAGSPISAIHHNFEVAYAGDGTGQPFNIGVAKSGIAGKRRVGSLWFGGAGQELRENLFLNFQFHFVGQFVAIRAKYLDAVILPGIMGSRDDDPG